MTPEDATTAAITQAGDLRLVSLARAYRDARLLRDLRQALGLNTDEVEARILAIEAAFPTQALGVLRRP